MGFPQCIQTGTNARLRKGSRGNKEERDGLVSHNGGSGKCMSSGVLEGRVEGRGYRKVRFYCGNHERNEIKEDKDRDWGKASLELALSKGNQGGEGGVIGKIREEKRSVNGTQDVVLTKKNNTRQPMAQFMVLGEEGLQVGFRG